MIVLDSSAIVAIMFHEAQHQSLVKKISADGERIVSPVTLLETTMVLSRTYSQPKLALDAYLRQANVVPYSIDSTQTELAQYAFLMYGKGRHPARLNIGDCFAYAAAKALNAPLLYTGDDFSKTDIRSA